MKFSFSVRNFHTIGLRIFQAQVWGFRRDIYFEESIGCWGYWKKNSDDMFSRFDITSKCFRQRIGCSLSQAAVGCEREYTSYRIGLASIGTS